MRGRIVKIIFGTVAATAVLGVGVAAAAPPTWAGGSASQVTKVAPATATGDQLRIRARDGTGVRHDSQLKSTSRQRLRDGTGPRHAQQSAQVGNRGADCPYRS